LECRQWTRDPGRGTKDDWTMTYLGKIAGAVAPAVLVLAIAAGCQSSERPRRPPTPVAAADNRPPSPEYRAGPYGTARPPGSRPAQPQAGTVRSGPTQGTAGDPFENTQSAESEKRA